MQDILIFSVYRELTLENLFLNGEFAPKLIFICCITSTLNKNFGFKTYMHLYGFGIQNSYFLIKDFFKIKLFKIHGVHHSLIILRKLD